MGAHQLAESIHMGRGLVQVGSNNDHRLQSRRFSASGLHQRQQVMLYDDRHRLTIVDLVGDFALLVGGINRTDRCAETGHGEPADDIFRAIGHEQAHLLALAYSQLLQRVGEGIDQGF